VISAPAFNFSRGNGSAHVEIENQLENKMAAETMALIMLSPLLKR
jgi:hypothetical protein